MAVLVFGQRRGSKIGNLTSDIPLQIAPYPNIQSFLVYGFTNSQFPCIIPMINGRQADRQPGESTKAPNNSATLESVLWATLYVRYALSPLYLTPHTPYILICSPIVVWAQPDGRRRTPTGDAVNIHRWKEKGIVFYYKIHLLGESLWPWAAWKMQEGWDCWADDGRWVLWVVKGGGRHTGGGEGYGVEWTYAMWDKFIIRTNLRTTIQFLLHSDPNWYVGIARVPGESTRWFINLIIIVC